MSNEIARTRGSSDLQGCFSFDACPCQNPLTFYITVSSMASLSLSLLLDKAAAIGAQQASNTPQTFGGVWVELTLHLKLSWYKTLPAAVSKGEVFFHKPH